MIGLENISLRYGQKVLFNEASAIIGARDRIGLVGPNGAGKTTLLRILTGQEQTDSGGIEKAGYVTIGYLPQETLAATGRSVFDEAASAFEDIRALQGRYEAASQALADLSADSQEYHDTLQVMGELQHRLEALEAHKLQSQVETVLQGLGFQMSDMQRDCGEFSGGWQMRIALARLLLREPSLLLLDEPTNHLDLDSLRWLESYLSNYEGALLIVSHDRAFLDRLCNRIFALRHGRLETYTGNYSKYEEEAAARYEQLLKAQKSQERKIAQTERFIERFRAKATKARQVQSRIKALDRIERIEIEDDESEIGFRFPPPARTGHVVIKATGLTKRYGSLTVLDNLDLEINRGDRVAVVGVNGAGKSTLSRVLAGVEPFDAGERIIGHNVSLSYFGQHQAAELPLDSTVLAVATDGAVEELRPKVRTILGSFLFRGDDVFKPVRVLSGGEKNRLALARMLLRPANFLILDEPTNHLDMASKEILQEALEDWGGAFLIVSHDRAFLDPIVNRVLEVSPGRVRSFPGNVSEYIQKVDAEREAMAATQAVMDKSAQADRDASNPRERRRQEAARRQQLAPLKREAEKLEKAVADKEATIARIEEELADPVFYKSEQAAARLQEYNRLKAEIDIDTDNWMSLLSRIEEIESS